jgi:hypothetical protein
MRIEKSPTRSVGIVQILSINSAAPLLRAKRAGGNNVLRGRKDLNHPHLAVMWDSGLMVSARS